MNDQPVMNKETGRKVLDVLSYQKDLTDREFSAFKDLYYVMERLDAVANRINSVDYPKNIPQETIPNGIEDRKGLSTGVPTPPDGLIGELVRLNEVRVNALNELKNKIIPNLFTAINYIEEHI